MLLLDRAPLRCYFYSDISGHVAAAPWLPLHAARYITKSLSKLYFIHWIYGYMVIEFYHFLDPDGAEAPPICSHKSKN